MLSSFFVLRRSLGILILLRDVLGHHRKDDPSPLSLTVEGRMARDIIRLAETSPHLLSDIGFERVEGIKARRTVRWRARQLPMLELTETCRQALWDIGGGR